MMNRMSFILLILSCFLAGTFLYSCTGKTAIKPRNHNVAAGNKAALEKVKTGDFIFRCGKDEVSQLFRRLNTSKQDYSHCGMAVYTDSGLRVCHIIGGADNPDGQIRVEKIEGFIEPARNERWAIVRYHLSTTEDSLFLAHLNLFSSQNITFDHQFDLATDDKMYCSEMLAKALIFATKKSDFIGFTQTISGKKYVAIDDLFQNKHCETICEIAY